MIAIPEKQWQIFREQSINDFVETLKYIAQNTSLGKYQKHPRGPKKKQTKKKPYKNGKHLSTAKILAKRKTR